MIKSNDLIDNLSQDLAPVSPVPNINLLATVWILLSAVFVLAVTHLYDPIRPGAYSQLATEPRFLLESLLGLVAIFWTALLAFRAAIPGALSRKFAAIGLILMALWLSQYVIGLFNSALDPSTLGKRDHCYIETMVYSLPPIMIGLFLVHRLYPLRFVQNAMSISLAAAMLPALYMQLACMYKPSHILAFHIFPGLVMVLAGAAIAALWRAHQQGVGGKTMKTSIK